MDENETPGPGQAVGHLPIVHQPLTTLLASRISFWESANGVITLTFAEERGPPNARYLLEVARVAIPASMMGNTLAFLTDAQEKLAFAGASPVSSAVN